ncbi:hypothetical protein ES707_21201 [subsurface metagenome]
MSSLFLVPEVTFQAFVTPNTLWTSVRLLDFDSLDCLQWSVGNSAQKFPDGNQRVSPWLMLLALFNLRRRQNHSTLVFSLKVH